MHQALSIYLPLFGFMLLPVWIPVLAVTVGRFFDLFAPRDGDTVAARVEAAKAHSRGRHVAVHLPTALPEVA